MTDVKANLIARKCIEKFDSLPKNGKPEKGRQWTTLAGFVKENKSKEEEPTYEVVALATGTTCLGSTQMCVSGKVVHDSHAEVLARRAFTRYLFQEILNLYSGCSIFVYCQDQKCLRLKKGISFHFYTSHSPCGDATIFPINNTRNDFKETNAKRRKICNSPQLKRRKIDDNTVTESHALDLNRTGAKSACGDEQHGKGLEYHQVGVLRIKPGRGIRTHSMSCSDKILKWSLVGCQGSLISIFLDQPMYLESIVLGKCISDKTALNRAVWGRLDISLAKTALNAPHYVPREPEIELSDVEFAFSKETSVNSSLKPCGSSLVWCHVKNCPFEVVAKNGYRLGTVKKTEGLAQSICKVSRYSMFEQCGEVACFLSKDMPVFLGIHEKIASNCSYTELKTLSESYYTSWKNVKRELLKDWVEHERNLDAFTLT